MRRILASGTFDILHPGHLHYLRESAALGNHLTVIISRGDRIEHKAPILSDEQRRLMVAGVEPVDEAILGSQESITEPLREVEPDVITLGHDQHFEIDTLSDRLAEAGFDVELKRISERSDQPAELSSSSAIIREICRQRARHHDRKLRPDLTNKDQVGTDIPAFLRRVQ